MTDEGTAAPHDDDGWDRTSSLSRRLSGDPSHELFGHGWTPNDAPPSTPEPYTGRHRAPDS